MPGTGEQVRLRDGAAVWREMDGETVVLDLVASRYLSVNSTGTALWPALARGATPAALAALLVDRFGIDEQQAHADVEAFLDTCRRRDLLVEE